MIDVIAYISRNLMLAVLVVALSAGCGDERHGDDRDTGTIHLSYWTAPNPEEYALARHLVDEWNTANPDIQVSVQPIPAGQSSEEILLAAVAAGTTPDLCSNIWPGITQDFIRAGGLLRLDQFSDFDSLMQSRLPEDLLESFRAADGHYYQIPWKTNPIMMQYNVGLFHEAGVDNPPRTYSEYLDAARRVTALPTSPWMGYRDIRPIWWQRYFDYYAFYIGASGGATLFRDGEIDIDAQASNRVLEFFHALYAGRYFPLATMQGGANQFLTGRLATEFTGPWNIAWLEHNAPPGLEYDFAPLPVPDDHEGPVYTYGDHKNIAIFSTTRHPDAAWRFAAYLVSKEADLLLLERARQIPVRKNLLEDETYADFFTANPMLVTFARQAPYTRGVDGVSDLKEILDAIARQFEAASVYGVRSASEATDRAVSRIRMIREWNS
ncbi:MAG: ABC transporter substrate-binding protein [Bacteroidota bacterium]